MTEQAQNTGAAPIPVVVQQHAEEAAILRHIRSVLVRAPHVRLHQLRRLDDRIAAHLDGLAVAGECGSRLCDAALEQPGKGEVFAATVRALEDKDAARLERLFALAGAAPEARNGLLSAFGWVSAQQLQGIVRDLLVAGDALRREVGIAACAMHRVDPGRALESAVDDADTLLRARALRVAGECGRRDLLAACLKAAGGEDETCRFWGAASAVLLGDRERGVAALQEFTRGPSPFREAALQLLLKVVDPADAHGFLRELAQDPANMRALIQGAGVAGDPHYVPWLIGRMGEPALTRLAGEAFSFITGLDLAYLDLERKPPEGVEVGPTDNPEDENVAMDADDSLPWPDPVGIQAWWEANKSRFAPGVRHFMGAPVNRDSCENVLREGFQRQRIAAALHLSLLQPGRPLFPTAAPAWRQKRWLDEANGRAY
jgi:uncharacterized protein (TIGR02270 family)